MTTMTVASFDSAVAGYRRERTVQVFNASHEPLRPVNFKRAVALLSAGRAVVHTDDGSGRFIVWAAESKMWPWPLAIRLTKYVQVAWEHLHGAQAWSKSRVLKRDHHICAYCLQPEATTVDHILPRAQGGLNTWTNTVAACESCNFRKADRTPEQAGMPLRRTPFVPRHRADRFGSQTR